MSIRQILSKLITYFKKFKKLLVNDFKSKGENAKYTDIYGDAYMDEDDFQKDRLWDLLEYVTALYRKSLAFINNKLFSK